jgi:hypothetical protein
MERWIQRSLFDLENLVGSEFDRLGDGVTVHGAELEGAQNQEIQRALEEFDPFVLLSGRHSRRS